MSGGGWPAIVQLTSDLDIYRTASVLIREHGDRADLVAARMVQEYLDKGEIDGSAGR